MQKTYPVDGQRVYHQNEGDNRSARRAREERSRQKRIIYRGPNHYKYSTS